jgi:hypothetical protein
MERKVASTRMPLIWVGMQIFNLEEKLLEFATTLSGSTLSWYNQKKAIQLYTSWIYAMQDFFDDYPYLEVPQNAFSKLQTIKTKLKESTFTSY